MNTLTVKLQTIRKSQFFKFLLIGGFCTLQNIFWLYLLNKIWGIHYIVAILILSAIVNTFGFLLNRRFTFVKKEGQFWQELWKYHTVMFSSLLTVLILMFIGVDILKADAVIANIVITVGMTIYNFLLHKKWTFK